MESRAGGPGVPVVRVWEFHRHPPARLGRGASTRPPSLPPLQGALAGEGISEWVGLGIYRQS